MNKQEIYQKALEKWGKDGQALKLAEECNELSRAVIRYILTGDEDNFKEEIADVKIMIEQMMLSFGQADILRWEKKKLKRLEGWLKE